MRMISKHVLSCWRKLSRAVEAGGEVRGEKRPDPERAQEIGAVRQLSGVAGVREEDVDKVRE